MLVLTRSMGESIVIGNRQVTIRVLEIRSGQVRLGVTAPRDIPVHREEIFDRISKQKLAAEDFPTILETEEIV